jgi:DNA-directed RNA polymerase subunit RPC12/RpoP
MSNCPHCQHKLQSMPTTCPYCKGKIIWGPKGSERDSAFFAARIFGLAGAIGLPIVGSDLDISWWILSIVGGVSGFMFIYCIPQRG